MRRCRYYYFNDVVKLSDRNFKYEKIKMNVEIKSNYTYLITYPDGKKYHGVRSCTLTPEEDIDYWGSSKITPGTTGAVKEILTVHEDRLSAALEEQRYHKEFNVAEDVDYYNIYNSRGGVIGQGRLRECYTGDDAKNLKEIMELYNAGKVDSCEKDKMLSAYISTQKAEKELLEAFRTGK